VRPRGFYFTISTKLSNLFDLFGTAREGLAPAVDQTDSTPTKQAQPPVAPSHIDQPQGGAQPR
jgi:hypothetical protein